MFRVYLSSQFQVTESLPVSVIIVVVIIIGIIIIIIMLKDKQLFTPYLSDYVKAGGKTSLLKILKVFRSV
jgi:hypothetical protein